MSMQTKQFRRLINGILYRIQYLRLRPMCWRLEARRRRVVQPYNPAPRISFVLQHFNKRENVRRILTALRACGDCEIIVTDDGSIDGSRGAWRRQLRGKNEFLIHSNDLSEVIMYDRAMRMAKGELVCFLQDDDIPPGTRKWADEALALFAQLPKLLILCGRDGLDLLLPDRDPAVDFGRYLVEGDIAGSTNLNKYRLHRQPDLVEPNTGIPFRYVMVVNRPPVFVHRERFLAMGGIDTAYAPVIGDDVDSALRSWLGGERVGLYSCDFRRNVSIGGLRMFAQDLVRNQTIKNWRLIYARYGKEIAGNALRQAIDDANLELSKR